MYVPLLPSYLHSIFDILYLVEFNIFPSLKCLVCVVYFKLELQQAEIPKFNALSKIYTCVYAPRLLSAASLLSPSRRSMAHAYHHRRAWSLGATPNVPSQNNVCASEAYAPTP